MPAIIDDIIGLAAGECLGPALIGGAIGLLGGPVLRSGAKLLIGGGMLAFGYGARQFGGAKDFVKETAAEHYAAEAGARKTHSPHLPSDQ